MVRLIFQGGWISRASGPRKLATSSQNASTLRRVLIVFPLLHSCEVAVKRRPQRVRNLTDDEQPRTLLSVTPPIQTSGGGKCWEMIIQLFQNKRQVPMKYSFGSIKAGSFATDHAHLFRRSLIIPTSLTSHSHDYEGARQ